MLEEPTLYLMHMSASCVYICFMLAFLHISVLVNICSAEDSSVILTTNINSCYKDKKKKKYAYHFHLLF